MTSRLDFHKYYSDEYFEKNSEPIRWSNVIFLPFHPMFKLIVLFSVVLKTFIGPLQAVYPFIVCTEWNQHDPYWTNIKYIYVYFIDVIYAIDTFLHIVHRQVVEEAMRREHLPKSAFKIVLDIVSLIPFFKLLSSETCAPSEFWPNILAFTEALIIYRVVEYFSLVTTHSVCKLVAGYVLLLVLIVNWITCFYLMLTFHGFCKNCHHGNYDWRSIITARFNSSNSELTTFLYGGSLVLSYLANELIDEMKPTTYLGFACAISLMLTGFAFDFFILLPKMFGESVLRMRRIYTFHPHVSRIIEETKKKSSSPNAHVHVEQFYALIWKIRGGITSVPEVINELPTYLRLDVREDLIWPVFYHSPTLRKTSSSYQRWLCEHIHLDYKLPGERFFVGPHCFTHLYYLKSGIVQLYSDDDSTTALLSVTSGTVFGDISFFVPPLRRKLMVRCLTYCEVYFVTRAKILMSLHKFPDDRRKIMTSAKERVVHARTLHSCKQQIRGIDRSEDEGIAWLKRRWWEISGVVSQWHSSATDSSKRELPPEEAAYHCSKYIGQLVLCTDIQLQNQSKSLFASVNFPWILAPNSVFAKVWYRIITCTVFFVLLLYPPNLSQKVIPQWFIFIQYWVDLMYIFDILVSLVTAVETQEYVTTSFATIMFLRFKDKRFIMDILSTAWMENFTIILGRPQFYNMCKFNRLIKTYTLFAKDTDWNVNKNPAYDLYFKIVLKYFCYIYISGYFFFLLCNLIPEITTQYFFGNTACIEDVKDKCSNSVLAIIAGWTFKVLYSNENKPKTIEDLLFAMLFVFIAFILATFMKGKCIASLYLKQREVTNFHYYTAHIKKHFSHYSIHPDLYKRLDNYFMCHWKYYKGVDFLHPNIKKSEPYDIYSKVHLELAEKIIGESRAFMGANPMLIRELAHHTNIFIMPQFGIFYLFNVQCNNVTWIIHGDVKCVYHDEKDELLEKTYDKGQMLSLSSVFLGKAAFRTYIAVTDCEALTISSINFFNIIKHYPDEWSYFEKCVEEIGPVFDEIFRTHMRKHQEYLKRLRQRIFQTNESLLNISKKPGVKLSEFTVKKCTFKFDFAKSLEPNSIIIQYWMPFRVITVIVSIMAATLQGGSGALIKKDLSFIGYICDCIAWLDICLKLFLLPYYDHRGLVISSFRMRMFHYLTRGFLLDVIGALPWDWLVTLLQVQDIDDSVELFQAMSKFAHSYLIVGYFNYITDYPGINITFIMIMKTQLVAFLLMLGSAFYFTSRCVDFVWDKDSELVAMHRLNGCWIPDYFPFDEKPTVHQLHILYAESLNLAQNGLFGVNLGFFHLNSQDIWFFTTFILLGLIFWYMMNYSQALLIVNFRGNRIFQHGVNQLLRFLKAERVDNVFIERAIAYFSYQWKRTRGMNVQLLVKENISLVLKEDLNYYFFRKTFKSLDTLLHGGEDIARKLTSSVTQSYFLPGDDIMREMDLNHDLFVVHRGRVVISRNGQKLTVLTKGAIFGQLDDDIVRPVRVTARAEDHVDVLQLPVKIFQDIITDKVRHNIALNLQSEDDYMAVETTIPENPYNTVQYILRGKKTIKLPRMSQPVEVETSTWYSRWLFLAWFCSPVTVTVLVLLLDNLPTYPRNISIICLLLLDGIHLVHFILEFYTMELIVVNRKCVNHYKRLKLFKNRAVYLDIISLLMPILSIITGHWYYHLARLLRLHLSYNFCRHFAGGFKTRYKHMFLQIVSVLLLLHALTCGWMTVACRRTDEKFPVPIPDMPAHINDTIDPNQWTHPHLRHGGCPRVTRTFKVGNKTVVGFVVPTNWEADYLVALSYIIIIHSQTNMDSVFPITLIEIYYKIFATIVLCFIEVWLSSSAVSYMYTKYRELYQYDFQVIGLMTFLKHNGLSASLLQSVRKYTSLMWQRQRGNWLPQITYQAPICLREDILGELYMHHFKMTTLFQNLPEYFLRQLVTRVHRTVIFPGKFIVREGDIFPCIYFIHEGEVEKWYTDANGESKMKSLLTTNGYFGLIPGLFPNTPYQFTYCSRTVVDFVFLKYSDWQDLLNGYPDVKNDLYDAAKEHAKTVTHHVPV